MKNFASMLLKRPLVLGILIFVLNLLLSILPILVMHEQHLEEFSLLFMPSELSGKSWLNKEYEIMQYTLIFSFFLSLFISALFTVMATFLKKSFLSVEKLSHFDGLTGLYNRLMFMTLFEKEIQKISRNKKTLFLVILDIDDFKPINDTYGHLVGDEAIRLTSQTLKSLLRSSDIIGRFGGDEFILGITDEQKESISHVINRILEEFNQKTLPVQKNDDAQQLQINLSIGYTSFKEGDDFKTMLHRADQGLYISKEAGKNTATYLA